MDNDTDFIGSELLALAENLVGSVLEAETIQETSEYADQFLILINKFRQRSAVTSSEKNRLITAAKRSDSGATLSKCISKIQEIQELYECETRIRILFARTLVQITEYDKSRTDLRKYLNMLENILRDYEADADFRTGWVHVLRTVCLFTANKQEIEIYTTQLNYIREVNDQKTSVNQIRNWVSRYLEERAFSEESVSQPRPKTAVNDFIPEKVKAEFEPESARETETSPETRDGTTNLDRDNPDMYDWDHYLYRLLGKENLVLKDQVQVRIKKISGRIASDFSARQELALFFAKQACQSRSLNLAIELSDRILLIYKYYGNEREIWDIWEKLLFDILGTAGTATTALQVLQRFAEFENKCYNKLEFRLRLAESLTRLVVSLRSSSEASEIANEIWKIHQNFGNEPKVRWALVATLGRASETAKSPARSKRLADQIKTIYNQNGNEPEIRLQYAQALFNAVVKAVNLGKDLIVAAAWYKELNGLIEQPVPQEWRPLAKSVSRIKKKLRL